MHSYVSNATRSHSLNNLTNSHTKDNLEHARTHVSHQYIYGS